MENRNPLEVFGRGKTVLRANDSTIFYQDADKHEHIIPILNIQKVAIGPSGFLHHGCLILSTAQSPAEVGFSGFPIYSNPDIRLNFLSEDEIPYAQNIQKYILDFQINATSGAAPTPHFSVADELIKLQALLDAGILTQEEFDRKKSKLLDG